MGRKFWAIFGIVLVALGAYNFTKTSSWAGLAAGVFILGLAAYLKDSEY